MGLSDLFLIILEELVTKLPHLLEILTKLEGILVLSLSEVQFNLVQVDEMVYELIVSWMLRI
jgi:hypothetical protein